MKKYLAIVAVGLGVTLGGCHVFKQPPVVRNVVVEKAPIVAVAPTLSNLDLRVTAIEHRLDVARAARARMLKPVVPAVR